MRMGLLAILQRFGDAVNEFGQAVLPGALFLITKGKLFVQNADNDAAELLLINKFVLDFYTNNKKLNRITSNMAWVTPISK